jgi:ribosomal protein S27E
MTEDGMIYEKNDALLKISCPHCPHERISAGLHVDFLPHVACPMCGGECDVFAMSQNEIIAWIKKNHPNGEDKEHANNTPESTGGCRTPRGKQG